MNKKVITGILGVVVLSSFLGFFGLKNYSASNNQDFEHSDFKIVEVVKNEKYQQLSYFFSGSFPIDLTKLNSNNQNDVDFLNSLPAIYNTSDIQTIYSETYDENNNALYSLDKKLQLGYFEQSLDGTGLYKANFYDKTKEYDLWLIEDKTQTLVENNDIDFTKLDNYFYDIDGRYIRYTDITNLQDDEKYVISFDKYAEDEEIDKNNSWNFIPAYSGNIYQQNEDGTYSLKQELQTADLDTYNTLSDIPKYKDTRKIEEDIEESTEATEVIESTETTEDTETIEGTETIVDTESTETIEDTEGAEFNESTESISENSTEGIESDNKNNTDSVSDSDIQEPEKIKGSLLVYELIDTNASSYAFKSIFSDKYTNPTVRVITYNDLTKNDIDDADLIYFNTSTEDTIYSNEYTKFNDSDDNIQDIDVFTSEIAKAIIDKLYDNKLIVIYGSEFKKNALAHDKLSKADLVYALTNNTYASVVKNGKLIDDRSLYDYLDSYDGNLFDLYKTVPTFTSAEDKASYETLARFNIKNVDLAYDICKHGIFDLVNDDLLGNWKNDTLVTKNDLTADAVGDSDSVSYETAISYLLTEEKGSGLGSTARLLEIEPCDDYTSDEYWNWRMFGVAPYFTGSVEAEKMNIDEFICKNTDLLSAYDIIFIGSNYNVSKQYTGWIVDDSVKKFSTAVDYVQFGVVNEKKSIPLEDLYKGDSFNNVSISVKASDHNHQSWQGNCDSNNLHEINVAYNTGVFDIVANTTGNYVITVNLGNNVEFTFTYIVLNTNEIHPSFATDFVTRGENWLENTAVNWNGSLVTASDWRQYTSKYLYKLNFDLDTRTTYFKFDTSSFKVDGQRDYEFTKPNSWTLSYYDKDLKFIKSETRSDGIFIPNKDAYYVRVSFDYSNLSERKIPYFWNAGYRTIKLNSTWSNDISSASWYYKVDDIVDELNTYTVIKPNEPVTIDLTEDGLLPSRLTKFVNTLSSDFIVDTSVDGQVTITYTGSIKNNWISLDYRGVEHNYSRPYTLGTINLFIHDGNVKWSSKGGFPTKFNDSNMNGKIYYHVGDITGGLTNTATNYLGVVDDNLTTYNPDKTTRLQGNDLTKKMYDKLVEYVESGRALICSEDLYNEDESINIAGIDTSSWIYQLMLNYNDKILNDKNGVDFDFSYLENSTFNLEFSELPLVYRDCTLFDFNDATKTVTFNPDVMDNWANGDEDFDYDSSDGGKTEYTYDELGISSSSDKNTAFYVNKNDKSKKEVQLKFKIDTTSSYSGTYNVKFYSDNISDGIFDDSEELGIYSIRDENGSSYNKSNLVSGKTYTLKVKLADDFSGCLHWKLLVTRGDSESIRGSYESYCAFLPNERTRLDILQILPYGAVDITSPWTLGSLDKYPAFKELMDSNTDYDIHITGKTAEEFNTMDFSEYLVNDGDIKKTFAQMDMIIVGFGDWADYIWSNDAIQNMTGYINSGRAVLFTHDTGSFVNSDNPNLQIKNLDYRSNPKKLKNYYINRYFRNLLGQDKYGVTLRDTLTGDDATLTQANASKADVKSLGAQSAEFLNIAKSHNKDLAYTLDSEQTSTYYDIEGLSDYSYTSTELGNPNIQKASCINRGQIVSYPYYIPDNINIANTHPQYYQLDLEDPNLTVWYSLDHNGASSHSGQGYYYIYNRKNITYSGVGHSELYKNMSTFEWRLYFNTLVMAYRQTQGISLEITDDYAEIYDDTVQVYADFATNSWSFNKTRALYGDNDENTSESDIVDFNTYHLRVVNYESTLDEKSDLYIRFGFKDDRENTNNWTYIARCTQDSGDFLAKNSETYTNYNLDPDMNFIFNKKGNHTFQIYFSPSGDFLHDFSSWVIKVELVKIAENGITQIEDTKYFRLTKRMSYNIR